LQAILTFQSRVAPPPDADYNKASLEASNLTSPYNVCLLPFPALAGLTE
jgi:hypothetical protein